jgi:hypothetical protein
MAAANTTTKKMIIKVSGIRILRDVFFDFFKVVLLRDIRLILGLIRLHAGHIRLFGRSLLYRHAPAFGIGLSTAE